MKKNVTRQFPHRMTYDLGQNIYHSNIYFILIKVEDDRKLQFYGQHFLVPREAMKKKGLRATAVLQETQRKICTNLFGSC